MRKWILRWLFGSNAKDFDDMFRITCECHASCKKLLQSNEFMLERYKTISSEQLEFLNALKDAPNIPDLMRAIILLLTESRIKDDKKEDAHG